MCVQDVGIAAAGFERAHDGQRDVGVVGPDIDPLMTGRKRHQTPHKLHEQSHVLPPGIHMDDGTDRSKRRGRGQLRQNIARTNPFPALAEQHTLVATFWIRWDQRGRGRCCCGCGGGRC